jgi:hypothetical protein
VNDPWLRAAVGLQWVIGALIGGWGLLLCSSIRFLACAYGAACRSSPSSWRLAAQC